MPKSYALVNNNVINAPQDQPYAWTYPTPGPAQLAQISKTP